MMAYTLDDGHLKSQYEEFVKKGSSILKMVATEELLYVLYNDRSIEILKADDIKQSVASIKSVDGAKDIVAMALAKNQLWVSDKDGMVFVLAADTLAKETDGLKTVYGHQAMSMAASADGSLVAIGDTKGYLTLFDCESRSQKSYQANHQNKILEIEFTGDGRVVTVSFDKMLCVATVEDNKCQKLSCPNGNAMTNSICLQGEYVMAAGYDCSIRKYKY